MTNDSQVMLLDEGHLADATMLDGLLERFPEPVLLLNAREEILWANRKSRELLRIRDDGAHPRLFDVWTGIEIMGPCFSPINMVLAKGQRRRTRVRVDEKTYYDLTVDPLQSGAEADASCRLLNPDESGPLLLVTLRDTSEETLQQQKLTAIYEAGGDLGDLRPDDVWELNTDERVGLLKSKLCEYTLKLLEFETVEVRILEERTGRLLPLLAFGMDESAEERELYASVTGNGVTGWVAATGRSYLCEDTENDPLYLVGVTGARSSLTVPLTRHGTVLGTFNVESFKPNAFTQTDLQYLELFCREVSAALNTLDLLRAEMGIALQASTKRVLSEVADPVDDILIDASWLYERVGIHDPQVRERLSRVLTGIRALRDVIRVCGSQLREESVGTVPAKPAPHAELLGKRLLVMDGDQKIRHDAHEILEPYGMMVETARDGEQAIMLARTLHYDAIIADIKPPDMPGSELYRRLREIHEHVPVMLMAGFGYDGSHTIVKARQMGMKTVLYKPFKLNQLLTALDDAVKPSRQAN